MTENEYVIVSNKAHISDALSALRQVMPFDNCGITKDQLGHLTDMLYKCQQGCFQLIEIEEVDE